jgi:phosphatidate cytidylyltransferase
MNQNLKLRIITSLIGVPIILTLLLAMGIEGVAIFAWVISMGMLYEFCRMFFNLKDANRKTVIALLIGTFLHIFYYVYNPGISAPLLGLGPVFGLSIVFLLLVPGLLNYGGAVALNSAEGGELVTKHVQELMAICFGMVYCVWFPLMLVAVREWNGGKFWVLLGLIIVWSTDVFAYFGGKYFGKHFLYETVSPKKTIEGAITGIVFAVLLGIGFGRIYLPGVSIPILTFIILTVSVSSIVGDLAESLLKRASGKKDSGSILPGHGGFLDRFDGVVFAMPALYTLLWLLT